MEFQLESFPKLQAWYTENYQMGRLLSDGEKLALQICDSLPESEHLKVDQVQKVIESCERNPDADLFSALEHFLKRYEFDLFAYLSYVAELAINSHKCDDYFLLTQKMADKTGLLSFNFLSAWIALNTDRLEDCVNECEKIDQPFAAIHTIHGQALIELGEVNEAINVLEVATQLSPKEVVAQFQLAKAYHLAGQLDQAWNSLIICDELAPGNPEIALMMAFTAAATANEHVDFAWSRLHAHLGDHSDNEEVVQILFDLAFLAKDKEKIQSVISGANWQVLSKKQVFLSNFTWILKRFQELNWMDCAASFLGVMTSEESTA